MATKAVPQPVMPEAAPISRSSRGEKTARLFHDLKESIQLLAAHAGETQ
jgi:hypothetical protein